LSPALHETEARELKLAAYSYELLDIEVLNRTPAEAVEVMREAVARGFTGFNVTHPCKQVVIEGLDELDPQAAALGAVNAVAVQRDSGRLIGHNTDHSGFLAAFREQLPDVSLGSAVLCGAGGAGAAVAHALATAGVENLIVADVDTERAAALAVQIGRQHTGMVAEGVAAERIPDLLHHADGVVNASPIGMEGFAGTPFNPAALHGGLWVADVVYRPVRTALLAAAERIGCRVLNGAQMLVAQAADTFALVTGVEPDGERMRRHLHGLLDNCGN